MNSGPEVTLSSQVMDKPVLKLGPLPRVRLIFGYRALAESK